MIRLLVVLASISLAAAACESTPKTGDSTPAQSTVAQPSTPSEMAPTLDGRSFLVQVTDPTGAVEPDTLRFANGMFDSIECTQYGFTPTKYEVSIKDGAMEFVATASSDKEGVMNWKGTVTGNKISGQYEWVKEGQATATATFKGSDVEMRGSAPAASR